MTRSIVLLALVLAGCLPAKPTVVIPPTPATMGVHVQVNGASPIAGALVRLKIANPDVWLEAVTPESGHVLLTVPASLTDSQLQISAPGWVSIDRHVVVSRDCTLTITLTAARPPPRQGLVRLDNRVFVDDGGPFLGVGASLFWAAWGYEHDRARLEKTLDYLADHGADYVRVLGVVGPRGWTDRTVDPASPTWADAIAGVTDLAYSRGLRVEWTVFGGLDTTPTPASRDVVVDAFLSMAAGRAQKIAMVEVANEAWSTGWSGLEPEARALGRFLRGSLPNLVAVTAQGCDATYYADGAGNVRTAHLDRDQGGEGGLWRPARQPWEMSFCSDPSAWTSNEPIGPGSSVASDDDPLRLTMAAAMTWLAGGAAYVYHARPGIRGGGKEDMEAYGGPADWWDVPNVEATFAGLKAVRALLPPDLPNWTRHNCNANFPDRPFDCDDSTHLRTYCATNGAGVVCLPLQIKGTLRLTARQPIAGQWYDALTGAQLGAFDVAAGGLVAIGGREAVIIKARR